MYYLTSCNIDIFGIRTDYEPVYVNSLEALKRIRAIAERQERSEIKTGRAEFNEHGVLVRID